MFVCQIEGKKAFGILKKKTMLSENIINLEIDDLIKNQFVNEDRNSLTEKGKGQVGTSQGLRFLIK